jgi:hypothetical protein
MINQPPLGSILIPKRLHYKFPNSRITLYYFSSGCGDDVLIFLLALVL